MNEETEIKEWFFGNGNIYCRLTYKNDNIHWWKNRIKHGICEEWRISDILPNLKGVYSKYIRENYKNDKRHGLCEYWYEDGTLLCRKNYKDGKLHGHYEYFYEDGNLIYEKYCFNNKEVSKEEFNKLNKETKNNILETLWNNLQMYKDYLSKNEEKI